MHPSIATHLGSIRIFVCPNFFCRHKMQYRRSALVCVSHWLARWCLILFKYLRYCELNFIIAPMPSMRWHPRPRNFCVSANKITYYSTIARKKTSLHIHCWKQKKWRTISEPFVCVFVYNQRRKRIQVLAAILVQTRCHDFFSFFNPANARLSIQILTVA